MTNKHKLNKSLKSLSKRMATEIKSMQKTKMIVDKVLNNIELQSFKEILPKEEFEYLKGYSSKICDRQLEY